MAPDFSGYATRNGLKCSDGRTIHADAFKDNDGQKVPLVWQHQHNDNLNVLGHAVLENRADGVYAYGFFNSTEAGRNAKLQVKHGDISALSIYANRLVQKGADVLHGAIREVSLVLSGANPGAFIDNVSMEHSDADDTERGEAIIYTGLLLEHSDDHEGTEPTIEHKEASSTMAEENPTVADIIESMTKEQKDVLYYLVGEAAGDGDSAEHSDFDSDSDSEDYLAHQEAIMSNVFEQGSTPESPSLSHAEVQAIVGDAQKCGSLKESVLAHAEKYGITNIDLLFPDAKNLTDAPDFVKRQTEWAASLMGGTSHTPFSRIKTMSADITHDEARAKGYVKGSLKKEEWFSLTKRVTTPTTIYKKQKLDRDDIVDITDLDVVAWLKAEMRVMLDEEIARAVLLGDGREVEAPDKIDETHIRPIAKEDDFYAHKITIPSDVKNNDLIEQIVRSRKFYKGTGAPTLYTTEDVLTDLLLAKDSLGRRYYETQAALEAALRVSKIVPVEVMENAKYKDLFAIMVNPKDYSIGADKGGAVSMFDDFDIDYNQYKYLIETRISGALTKFKSAIVFKKGAPSEPAGVPKV